MTAAPAPTEPGTAAASMRPGERGAALIVAVLFAAALSVIAGAVTWFALLATQASAAGRDHAEVEAATVAALEIAAAAIGVDPDLAAVRRGATTAAINGTSRLGTVDGVVDVASLGASLARRRGRLPFPADAAVWHPYLWGRLGEILATPIGTAARDPLVVVWVRGDDAAGLGADRIELAVAAVGPSAARASAMAIVRVGARGAALVTVSPDAGIAGPG